MAIDYRLLEELKRRSEMQSVTSNAHSEKHKGGGSEPPDQSVGRRLAALEASSVSIDKILAVMSEQIKHVASREDFAALSTKLDSKASTADLAVLSGRIDRTATATDLAELKGRVARIPTVPVLVSVGVLVSLIFGAAAWTLRHLPAAWTAAFQ